MFLQISGQAAIFDTYSIASRIYSNSSEPKEEHYGKFGEWACSGYEEEFENEKVLLRHTASWMLDTFLSEKLR